MMLRIVIISINLKNTGKRLLAGLLCAGAICSYADSEITDITLSIGNGMTTVREVRHMDLQRGEQDLVITALPRQINPLSLQLRSLRSDLVFLDWQWVRREGEVLQDTGFLRKDDTLTWHPGASTETADILESIPGEIHCRVRSPRAGRQALELIYLVEPIHWRVEYQIVVHGAMADSTQKLSVDFKGYVGIDNQTDHAFNKALIHILSDKKTETEQAHLSGFLMLNEESALSDLWGDKETGISRESMYVLPRRVNLAPYSVSDVEYVSVLRIPARRRYLMSHIDIPITVGEQGIALREVIIFENTEEKGRGLGRALPAGPAIISKGGASPQILPGAFIPHTSVGDEIRLDLGLSRSVRGLRRELIRKPAGDGIIDITYEIFIFNDRPVRISVEVEEKPPLTLPWDVFRSDATYLEHNKALFFDVEVPARSEKAIRYTVHVYQPEV